MSPMSAQSSDHGSGSSLQVSQHIPTEPNTMNEEVEKLDPEHDSDNSSIYF